MIENDKTESWLQANFYVAILVLLVYVFMPFFWSSWATAHCEEDAYYYFAIARNLADGKGITYNGEWTNGFQPLWLFFLSPIFLFKSSLIFPLKLALLVGGLFFLLGGFMVYRSGLLLFSEKSLARFSAILWLTSVFAFEQSVNGLETGLYFFCLSLLVYVYLKRIRLNENPGLRDWVYLGLLSGICFLARIDVCLILIPLWIAGGWHSYRADKIGARALCAENVETKVSRTTRKNLYFIFIGFLVFLALALPWVFYNLWLWANPLPVSALFAKLQFWQKMTFKWRAVMSIKALLRLPIFYPFSFYTFFRHWNRLNFILLVIGSGIWLVLFIFDRKLREKVLRLPLISFIFAGAFLTLGYMIPTTAHWFIPRYLSPLILLLSFYIAIFWHHYLRKVPVLFGIICACLVFVLVYLDFYGVMYKQMNQKYYMNFYRLENIEWIKKNLPENAPIGCFQSGIYHYYLTPEGYTVYNLDGKMSISAYKALKGNYLGSYIRDKGIVYVIDWPQYLQPFFRNYKMERDKDYRILATLGSDSLAEMLYNNRE